MKYLYALIVLLMALFLAAFITQNGQDVVLKYFYWQTVPLPLSLFMILAFAAGYALAVVVGLASGIKSRIRVFGAEREAKRLRAEVQNIRKKDEEGTRGDTTDEVTGKEEETSGDDLEEDAYTTVKFPKKEDLEEDVAGGEEEKGES